MSRRLDHQAGQLDQQGTVAMAMSALRLNFLRILVEIGAQELAQVGMGGALPSNGEDLSCGRDIFLYGDARGSLNLMDREGIVAGRQTRALHFFLVGLNRRRVTTQGG